MWKRESGGGKAGIQSGTASPGARRLGKWYVGQSTKRRRGGRAGEKAVKNTHPFADRTLNRPLTPNTSRALGNHIQDGGLLETMRAFAAGDGVFVGEEGEWAFDAYALAGDGYVIVCVVCVGGGGLTVGVGAGVAAACECGEAGVGWEPGRCVREGGRVVAGVQGVVHDALEADVGVVGRVSVHETESS